MVSGPRSFLGILILTGGGGTPVLGSAFLFPWTGAVTGLAYPPPPQGRTWHRTLDRTSDRTEIPPLVKTTRTGYFPGQDWGQLWPGRGPQPGTEPGRLYGAGGVPLACRRPFLFIIQSLSRLRVFGNSKKYSCFHRELLCCIVLYFDNCYGFSIVRQRNGAMNGYTHEMSLVFCRKYMEQRQRETTMNPN